MASLKHNVLDAIFEETKLALSDEDEDEDVVLPQHRKKIKEGKAKRGGTSRGEREERPDYRNTTARNPSHPIPSGEKKGNVELKQVNTCEGVKKTKSYRKRKLVILGKSPAAPQAVTQPLQQPFDILTDWYNFTIEYNPNKIGSEAPKQRNLTRNFDDTRPVGDRNSSQYVPRKPKLEYFMIFADESKVYTSLADKVWVMPRGPIEKALNMAYNRADLVLVFYSDRILGCARVGSAVGFRQNKNVPSCDLSDSRGCSLRFDECGLSLKEHGVDGCPLTEEEGRRICHLVGLPLHPPSAPSPSQISSGGTRRMHPNSHRNSKNRPTNCWNNYNRPNNMHHVDSSIFEDYKSQH